MRRKWFIPVATFALVGGSMLAATGAASASTGSSSPHAAVQPGGVARHLVTPFGKHGHTAATSTNWSGYATSGSSGQFTSVSASWTEPATKCSSGSQYSAFWVGLDGYSSSTVEQTGSESDCNGSRPVYSAWWEMYPGGSHNFSNTVQPGDKFSASVTYAGGSSYTLKISDSTQGWSHTMNESLTSGKRSSAEVIVEAPCCTAGGGILPLANFGKVPFTNSEVNGSPIGNSSPTKIVMASGSTKKDSISALSGGTNFSATWLHK
ncbi:MAG TPA: G1 family glutamic endopeptidase [Streptosporangiaceae bacterium]|jgi:hypothetical protein